MMIREARQGEPSKGDHPATAYPYTEANISVKPVDPVFSCDGTLPAQRKMMIERTRTQSRTYR